MQIRSNCVGVREVVSVRLKPRALLIGVLLGTSE